MKRKNPRGMLPVTAIATIAFVVGCAEGGAERGRPNSQTPNNPMAGATGGAGMGTPGAGGSSAATGAGPGVGSGGAQPGTGGAGTGEPGTPGVVPGIRRLSHTEYDNTVLDVLKTTQVTRTGDAIVSGFGSTFARDNVVDGYDNARAVLAVTPALAAQYRDVAKKLAVEALTGAGLTTLAPCAGGTAETACAASFVSSMGASLFRRPVTGEESTRLTALFDTERTRSDYAASIQQVLEAMLQSPQFLYRSEYGVPGAAGTRVLTSHETASLLSYAFWSAPPDAELLAAASQDQLATPAAREAQARRLMQSPRARVPLERFMTMWTMTDGLATVPKSTEVYPMFDAAMRQATVLAQADFIRKTTWDGDGSLNSLLMGDTGMLSQPWLLTVHSRSDESFPIARGKFVRTRVLCQELPVPPKDLNVMPVPKDPNATTIERFAAHSSSPACSGCHMLIDPVGFGFERYDGIGQYRTMENGKPVDDAGDLTATEDANGPFHGPSELGTRLAASAEVQRCMARQAFRYAMGYTETAAEVTALAPVLSDLKLANNNIRELFVLLAKSDQFVTRTANP
ncbi:MAG: DUF1588 domain-containing protein [Polyangiaceae bacterium]|nr:DUF1588 domain-containing protein [Polyangiaceae bacterium]